MPIRSPPEARPPGEARRPPRRTYPRSQRPAGGGYSHAREVARGGRRPGRLRVAGNSPSADERAWVCTPRRPPGFARSGASGRGCAGGGQAAAWDVASVGMYASAGAGLRPAGAPRVGSESAWATSSPIRWTRLRSRRVAVPPAGAPPAGQARFRSRPAGRRRPIHAAPPFGLRLRSMVASLPLRERMPRPARPAAPPPGGGGSGTRRFRPGARSGRGRRTVTRGRVAPTRRWRCPPAG